MQSFFNLVKKFLPATVLKKIRPFGHGFLAYLGAVLFRHPSRQMIVIGITGTAGKSTTAQMLSKILNDNGRKTGYVTTVEYFDGETVQVNKQGMSMPGRFALQKYLASMLENACEVAILEVTSEGLAQNRHIGIDFDFALFTNLAEAHLDSHGGFENYKKAKGILFDSLKNSYSKKVFKQKVIGVNLDDQYAAFFTTFEASRKFGISFKSSESPLVGEVYRGDNVQDLDGYNTFTVEGAKVSLKIPGSFNACNALMAISCANILGVGIEEATRSINGFAEISGRMQEIPTSKGFRIFLDYAPEPLAMYNALMTVNKIPHKRVIHVFGSTGGHRDVAKRFEFGEISALQSDVIIITNDDVYDSDPQKIAGDIRTGIDRVTKNPNTKKVREVQTILDRREAIQHALSIAREGDVVLITGKGSEQFLVLPGDHRIEWDERTIIQECL